MDIQKRITRYLNKYSQGGKFVNLQHFQKLIKIAEEQDRAIIVSIDGPGTCVRHYQMNLKDIDNANT